MSEMSEDLKAYKQFMQEEKEKVVDSRFEHALNEISKLENVEITSSNDYNYQIVALNKNTNEKFVFYAWTGKITGHEQRGLRNFIKLLKRRG